MSGTKLMNDYVRALGYGIYEEAPKAVIAAVAVSMIQRVYPEAENEDLGALFAEEWKLLNENGIVPQALGKKAREAHAAAPKDEEGFVLGGAEK